MVNMPRPIDWDLVELFVRAGATQTRIADYLCIHKDTLRDRVKDKYKMDYSVFSTSLQREGEMLLEAEQYTKAMTGNVQLLIHLGKVRLGQKEAGFASDKPPNEHSINYEHIIMSQANHIKELTDKLDQLLGDKDASRSLEGSKN
jgi:hypothetical protein